MRFFEFFCIIQLKGVECGFFMQKYLRLEFLKNFR
jgi:hypothetical protein